MLTGNQDHWLFLPLLESCSLSKQGQYVHYDSLDASSRFELRYRARYHRVFFLKGFGGYLIEVLSLVREAQACHCMCVEVRGHQWSQFFPPPSGTLPSEPRQ